MSDGKLWVEKRRHQRLDLSFSVKYFILRGSLASEDERQGRTVNISRGGIRLVTDEELKAGSLIQMTIALPEEKAPLEGKAEVAWAEEKSGKSGGREYHYGLQFTEFKGENDSMITRFMMDNIKKMSGI